VKIISRQSYIKSKLYQVKVTSSQSRSQSSYSQSKSQKISLYTREKDILIWIDKGTRRWFWPENCATALTMEWGANLAKIDVARLNFGKSYRPLWNHPSSTSGKTHSRGRWLAWSLPFRRWWFLSIHFVSAHLLMYISTKLIERFKLTGARSYFWKR
jgi:hypothetical protein